MPRGRVDVVWPGPNRPLFLQRRVGWAFSYADADKLRCRARGPTAAPLPQAAVILAETSTPAGQYLQLLAPQAGHC